MGTSKCCDPIFLLTPNGMTVDAEKELSILAGRNFEGLDTYDHILLYRLITIYEWLLIIYALLG